MIQTLFEREDEGQVACLPDELRAEYGGDLRFPAPPPDRPYVAANFVSTLDGVISFNIPRESGGAEISGRNPGDRFTMGLLRASADAVLVGAGTVAAVSHAHLWVAEHIWPQAAESYRRYRHEVLGKAAYPLVAIVSGTGRIDLSRAVFHAPGISVLVLTTESGRATLRDAGVGALSSTSIRILPASDGKLKPAAILERLKNEFGASLVVHEGGPALFGQFLMDRCVDELFLTLAPQIAGRSSAHPRPGLVMNSEFLPETAPWLSLRSVKRGEDHLYLRYRLAARRRA